MLTRDGGPCESVLARIPARDALQVQFLARQMAGFMLQDAFVALAYGPQKDGVCIVGHAHALHALALEGMKVGTSHETRLCLHVTRDGQAP